MYIYISTIQHKSSFIIYNHNIPSILNIWLIAYEKSCTTIFAGSSSSFYYPLNIPVLVNTDVQPIAFAPRISALGLSPIM